MTGPTNGGRARAYEALRDSEELHRATLSSISDAVFLSDDEGAFTYICPNVDVIFGYVPDEVQAMGSIAQLLGQNLFSLTNLISLGELRNIEREITAKSGLQRTVLIQIKRVSIKNGTVLFTCRDITELRQAEKALAATRLELAHAARLALVGELSASIVHEIQQPLTAILANATTGSLLAQHWSEGSDVTKLREIFDDIQHEGSDTAQIIERVRTLVRKRPLELQVLDVDQLFHDVLHLVAADANRRHVTVSTELQADLPKVLADRVSVQQVMLNLVVNAMDAMEHTDRGKRRVIVRTRRDADAVQISVSDSGHGIAAEDLPRLFEAFYTTKKDGIGLGLAISRSIVEAQSGTIWAESDSSGATFYFTLPVAAKH
jgi:PAS domain S-box-containing protein